MYGEQEPTTDETDYSFPGSAEVTHRYPDSEFEPPPDMFFGSSTSHPTTILTPIAPTVLLLSSENPYAPNHPIIRLDITRNGETEEVSLPPSGSWTVGRDPAIAHYSIDSAGVSRAHAEWICEAGQVQIRDLGSRNGTYLNGELLVPFKPQPFDANDVMVIVQTEFRLHSKNSR